MLKPAPNRAASNGRHSAAFRRLCVETALMLRPSAVGPSAAFRRLCVETKIVIDANGIGAQPPSGGCVLKQNHHALNVGRVRQPPSGGCVLKPDIGGLRFKIRPQPPSGGCVLKLRVFCRFNPWDVSAAFRRLCVETPARLHGIPCGYSAAFRRLCVETLYPGKFVALMNQPPSGGCVLKLRNLKHQTNLQLSRLQAAVC